ncbi:MAG: SPOR domain-containing protein [Bacteroidales bacterium]|nr:SPOR domain-containing protein [Bacteroidales bacterium]
MRKMTLVIALALAASLVSGCDFFRTLAGRPTSRDIEAKRARLELASRREQARQDSLARVKAEEEARALAAVADSLHAIDTLTHIGKLHKASSYVNIPAKRLRSPYAVVVGVFSTEANAERLAKRYEAEGFEAYVLKYYSSLCAVLVSPCDKIADALSAYRRVRALPYASKETWVLSND